MVDIDRQPSGGGMAQAAIHTQLAVVLVILLMAGETIAGSPLKNVVDMAIVASNCQMLAIQFERGKVVVKGGRRPARRGVAGTAIGAQPAFMGILTGMAGEAVLGGGAQVFQRPGVDMAASAGNLCMQAHQWKIIFIVVKIAPIGVQSIMAGKTAIPKGDRMLHGERTVNPGVAGFAGSLIELGEIVADMAIAASKGSLVWFDAMGFKRITLGLMRKFESARIGQRGIQTAMVGVTDLAGCFGIGQVQGAVQPGGVGPLDGYIRMT